MASLMVYKNQINKATGTQPEADVVLQLPKLSDVPQDEQQGFIADISSAIAKHEDTEGSKDQDGNVKPKASFCLFHSTNTKRKKRRHEDLQFYYIPFYKMKELKA